MLRAFEESAGAVIDKLLSTPLALGKDDLSDLAFLPRFGAFAYPMKKNMYVKRQIVEPVFENLTSLNSQFGNSHTAEEFSIAITPEICFRS